MKEQSDYNKKSKKPVGNGVRKEQFSDFLSPNKNRRIMFLQPRLCLNICQSIFCSLSERL